MKFKRAAQSFSSYVGWDPRILVRSLRGTPTLVRTVAEYTRSAKSGGLPIEWGSLFPIASDLVDHAGQIDGHYFQQDLFVARRVLQAKPKTHVDIGSRVDGFVAHLLSTMPVTMVDVRALPSLVEGLSFIQDDATHLSQFKDGSIASLSSLHAVEHFGLGRYGDPVDADADAKAMRSFARVLAPGGRLYFSVPVGRERVEFNAHRIYDPERILNRFSSLKLAYFSVIDDAGKLIPDVSPGAYRTLDYGCGMFEFTK